MRGAVFVQVEIGVDGSETAKEEWEQLIPFGGRDRIVQDIVRPLGCSQALQISAKPHIDEVEIVNLGGSLVRRFKHAAYLPGVTTANPREVVANGGHRDRAELALQTGERVRDLSGAVGIGSEGVVIGKCRLKNGREAQPRGADSENGLIDFIAGNIPSVANGKRIVAISDLGSGGRVTWELRRNAVDVVGLRRSGRY